MYNTPDIEKNITLAFEQLDSIGINYELVLVDDGSTSPCFEEALRIKRKNFKVVGYKQNQGKGNALLYGFKFVKGENVAFVDSGGDINASQLKNFLSIMQNKKADIVIGSKKHPDSIVIYPLARRFMSSIYQFINHLLFDLNVQDTQVGIKLFTYDILSKIFPLIAIKRFAFDLELLVIATKFNASIIEAPVEIQYQFKSTINPKAVFFMLWDTAAIFYRDTILNYYGKRISPAKAFKLH